MQLEDITVNTAVYSEILQSETASMTSGFQIYEHKISLPFQIQSYSRMQSALTFTTLFMCSAVLLFFNHNYAHTCIPLLWAKGHKVLL